MKKAIYLFEFILFLFIVFYRFIVLKYLSDYAEIILVIGWFLAFIIFYKKFGLRKDNSLIKKQTIQIIIIGILLFILLGYLSGLIFGFLRNSYALDLFNIIKNIYPLIFMIIFQELIRYMIAKRGKDKDLPLVIITILYVLMDIVLTFNSSHIASDAKIFIFITNNILPSVARNLLCSYMCMKVSFVPGMILRLFFNIYIYIFPIFPDYGYYISSLIGLVLPYILYVAISKLVEVVEHRSAPIINQMTWFINIPLFLIIVFMLFLTTGIFKYQALVIGSGSMKEYLDVGDIVIYEKLDKEEQFVLEEDDIIVYIKNNQYVIHRIVEMETVNNKRYYQTKGDNNKEIDDYKVTEDQIKGVVRLRIKGIGWPTIWFQELIS